MYLRQNVNNDKPYQTVQFMSLKKKNNQKLIAVNDNKITFHSEQQAATLLTILGIYEFTTGTQINQQVFASMNLQQCPKVYQSYAHQKTMKALLKVIKDNSESQNSLVSLVDQFPIVSFVLQAYCRAVCLNYLKNRKDIFLYGNEQELLQNFSIEIRGQLLQIMADALGMHITLICGQFTQFYGQENNKRKVSISYSENGIQAELISSKKQPFQMHFIRTNQHSATKTLKQLHSLQTETSQSQQISSIDSNSLLKDSIATSEISRCDRCKLLKNRCFCSKKVVSTYDTPKSATNNQRSPAQQTTNANIFSILNQSKCVCHKIVCTCRK